MKVVSLVGGMVAGADSIDDMALLRHGGMVRVFARASPWQWGSNENANGLLRQDFSKSTDLASAATGAGNAHIKGLPG